MIERRAPRGGAARRRRLRGAAALIAIGISMSLSACAPGKPDPVPSDDGAKATVTVRVVDNVYEPAEVEVKAGEAVRWVFEGPGEHDVVSDDRGFVSELMPEGSYTHLFEETGDYAYLCSIHPEMRGIVHVVAP